MCDEVTKRSSLFGTTSTCLLVATPALSWTSEGRESFPSHMCGKKSLQRYNIFIKYVRKTPRNDLLLISISNGCFSHAVSTLILLFWGYAITSVGSSAFRMPCDILEMLLLFSNMEFFFFKSSFQTRRAAFSCTIPGAWKHLVLVTMGSGAAGSG